jgi:hypothetical protein
MESPEQITERISTKGRQIYVAGFAAAPSQGENRRKQPRARRAPKSKASGSDRQMSDDRIHVTDREPVPPDASPSPARAFWTDA